MRLGVAEHLRYLSTPAVRAGVFVALLLLGIGYIGAFSIFVKHSQDFIVAAQNQSARDFSASNAVALPSTVLFTSTSPAVPMLGGGWHRPQPDGIWASLNDATLEMTVKGKPRGVRLRIHLDALIAPRHPRQTISVGVNDATPVETVRTSVNVSDPIDVVVAPETMRGGRLSLHFHTESLASPFVIHSGADERALGFRLHSIDVLEP